MNPSLHLQFLAFPNSIRSALRHARPQASNEKGCFETLTKSVVWRFSPADAPAYRYLSAS
jgi:hypothetical protein